jgi:DNA invertase Pin-like site-specific DNA recombinase
MRVALYARVSTDDQHAENQLLELRRYVAARGWAGAVEFVDEGISGAKTRRPALDRLMQAARRRQVDAVVCWRLDRLGRGLAHLLAVVNEWTTLGVAFISLGEGIDATTPAGRCSSTSSARSRSSSADAYGSASWPVWRAPSARGGVWVGDGRRRCLRARRAA